MVLAVGILSCNAIRIGRVRINVLAPAGLDLSQVFNIWVEKHLPYFGQISIKVNEKFLGVSCFVCIFLYHIFLKTTVWRE